MALIQNNDLIPTRRKPMLLLCGASRVRRHSITKFGPHRGGRNLMKAAQSHCRTTIFGGLVAAIGEGLSAPRRASGQALALAGPHASAAAGRGALPARPGFLGRLGERLWRRQLKSMDLQIARSDDLFADLDRWLWKQRQRETEA